MSTKLGNWMTISCFIHAYTHTHKIYYGGINSYSDIGNLCFFPSSWA
jgi:hypothetical protein